MAQLGRPMQRKQVCNPEAPLVEVHQDYMFVLAHLCQGVPLLNRGVELMLIASVTPTADTVESKLLCARVSQAMVAAAERVIQRDGLSPTDVQIRFTYPTCMPLVPLHAGMSHEHVVKIGGIFGTLRKLKFKFLTLFLRPANFSA